MNDLIKEVGIPAAMLIILAYWYAKKDKQHREEREQLEKSRREEREELAKVAEKQFDRIVDLTNKINDSFNKNTDIVSSMKTMLEHRK